MLHRFFHDYEKTALKPLEPWQKRRLTLGIVSVLIVSILFLCYACITMAYDKEAVHADWDAGLVMDAETAQILEERSQNAIPVTCGTYLEYIRELSLRNGTFRASMQVWFRWEGDPELNMKDHFRFYKGSVNSKSIIVDRSENGVNYQLLQVDVTVSKNFATNRFPLDNHALRLYLESEYPVEQVRLVLDQDSSINSGLHLSGYDVVDHAVHESAYLYDSVHGDPALENAMMSSEIVTSALISRSGLGLYMKCFIALFGTTLWVFIALFICTYHHVDPLGMIPAALFGSVSNIMVGANLLPDALSLGLLEYVNAWGVLTIIACALVVININRIRNKYQDREFAKFFGRIMFSLLILCVLAGHIIMPLCANGL